MRACPCVRLHAHACVPGCFPEGMHAAPLGTAPSSSVLAPASMYVLSAPPPGRSHRLLFELEPLALLVGGLARVTTGHGRKMSSEDVQRGSNLLLVCHERPRSSVAAAHYAQKSNAASAAKMMPPAGRWKREP